MRVRPFYYWLILLVAVPLLLYAVDYFYFYYQEKPLPGLPMQAMPPINANTRLLVIAPHCDDETLGTAGMIHDVIQAGGHVRVVIVTNGDGFTFATEEEFKRLLLTGEDYVQSGYTRQRESKRALALLGVPAQDILFLGYPDRGITSLWETNWDLASPYTSRYTQYNHSPYSATFHPGAVYAGQNLLNDLQKIILSFAPNYILAPHPNDEHPDHAAVWAFILAAVLENKLSGQLEVPNFFTYLVHRGDYPIPHGYLPNASLLPPKPLALLYPSVWHVYPLPPELKNLKRTAIEEYRSQIKVPIMAGLLNSFTRQNELFAEPNISSIATVSSTLDLRNLSSWQQAPLLLENPAGINPLSALEQKGKIMSVYGLIQDRSLWLHLPITGFSATRNGYHLAVISWFRTGDGQYKRDYKAFSFDNSEASIPPSDIFRYKEDVIIKLPFPSHPPAFFYLRAITKDHYGAVINHSAWQPILNGEI
ncbi:glcnac-pi de-n-acetylase [Lucifera butyrica]|uniref:Glcnac-pi de-n-acetylase n=1 Tax=Lucifera butyrica TaxID=1351585 RepID=A0A498RBC3_9FIRM|nr:PIG-L family deacetylase [Lucifera butyrica]VBB07433.1 glcnac-pi de-n-acetylase [Lucifera butyrica]